MSHVAIAARTAYWPSKAFGLLGLIRALALELRHLCATAAKPRKFQTGILI
jgi:hypothetical protein